MSTGLATTADADGGGMIVRPQTNIGVAAEQQRVQAEIQSRLLVARSCPRDEVDAVDRIKNSCQRLGVAEAAEYSYSRGGTEITGPTIDLLTIVANHWGNLDYGFRVIQSGQTEDTVECFAWDLQSNAKKTVVVTIPRLRYTRNGSTPLKDPRDIYENIANNAQRRVRHCLEAIVPPDVVEDAVAQCRETLATKADTSPEALRKMCESFAKIGVTKEQIEARIQRRLESIQPAQFISLRRIFKSIHDGMSKAADWFADADKPESKTAADAAKDALKGKSKAPSAEPPAETHDRPETTEEVCPDTIDAFRSDLADCNSLDLVEQCQTTWLPKSPNEPTTRVILGECEARRGTFAKGKSKQKELV